MSEQFRVKSAGLNFRSAPELNPINRIAVLSQGHIVNRLEGGPSDHWWKVSTTINGRSLEGFVAREHLSPVGGPEDSETLIGGSIPPVHLVRNGLVARNQESGRAFPLNEAGQPGRNTANPAQSLTDIVDWLNVERSKRYLPKPLEKKTFCNIYAYDYAYLAGVFLPRVWWTSRAIVDLTSGRNVPILYDDTVNELNANSIFNWFAEFGTDFGWKRVFDLTELQDAANQGQVCIISGQRENLNKPGHICAVVPEIDSHKASRQGTKVIMPLQSQAGARNFSRHVDDWWLDSKFRSFSFWKHA